MMEQKQRKGKKKDDKPEPPKVKPLVVLVDLDNTLSALNEAMVHRYEELYQPKKKRFICPMLTPVF